MSNDNPRLARGIEVIKQVGGQPPPPGRKRFPNLPPEQADAAMTRLTEFCFGDTWGGPHLDLKTRRLLTLAAVAAQGTERFIRPHLAGALAQGISREEVTETLLHLIPYVGFPRVLAALELANEVFGQQAQS